jgi:hypothetical protein
MSILPDLNGSGPETLSETLPEPDPAPRAEVLTENITEVPNYAFEELRQQNTILQQALTAERLRARIREKSSASSSRRKNGRS